MQLFQAVVAWEMITRHTVCVKTTSGVHNENHLLQSPDLIFSQSRYMCRVCPIFAVFLLRTASDMTLQEVQRLINYDRSLISRHDFGIKPVTGSLHKDQLGFHTM